MAEERQVKKETRERGRGREGEGNGGRWSVFSL